MPQVTTFLWFDANAEEAINHYISIFPNSKIVSAHRQGDKLFTATFELNGRPFMALNGGPMYKFTEAISLFVDCETQEEIDTLWAKLTEGGSEIRCGWLKDKFGLTWQIIPNALGELLYGPDPAKSQRVMQAMLQMNKLDIAKLREA